MMYNSSQIRDILFQCISGLEKQPEKYALDPEKDFSRRRKLPFYTLSRVLLSMAASCVDGEMVRYFELSNDKMPTFPLFSSGRTGCFQTHIPICFPASTLISHPNFTMENTSFIEFNLFLLPLPCLLRSFFLFRFFASPAFFSDFSLSW